MNQNRPIISVVIPVRNCESTISYTLRSVLNQNTQNFEVIVSDNCCDDDTAAVVQSIKDHRIKYFKTLSRLSMCDSYEFAVSKATGQFVIVIGGDDGMHPNALDRLEQEILTNNYKMYWWGCRLYKWPNTENKSYEDTCNLHRFKNIEVFDTVSNAKANMKLGGWRYENLVSVYHSATSREVIEQIKKDHGRLFYTTQPDVYTSYIIPAYISSVKMIKDPITISGHSKHGNSAVTIDKNNKNYDTFMAEYGNYKLDKNVPKGMPLKEGTILEPLYVAKSKCRLYDDTPINTNLSWANAVFNTRYTKSIFTNWMLCAKNTSIIDFLMVNFYVVGIYFYKKIRALSGNGQNSFLHEVPQQNVFDYSIESKS